MATKCRPQGQGSEDAHHPEAQMFLNLSGAGVAVMCSKKLPEWFWDKATVSTLDWKGCLGVGWIAGQPCWASCIVCQRFASPSRVCLSDFLGSKNQLARLPSFQTCKEIEASPLLPSVPQSSLLVPPALFISRRSSRSSLEPSLSLRLSFPAPALGCWSTSHTQKCR